MEDEKQGSVLRTVVGRAAALGLASAIQLMTLAFLARGVGPADFGHFSQLAGIGLALGALGGFGLTLRMLRLGGSGDAARVAFTAVLFTAGVAVVDAVLVVAIGQIVTGGFSAVSLAAAMATLVEIPTQAVQALLSGRQRFTSAAVVLTAQRLIVLCAIWLLPVSSGAALAIGYALALLVLAAYLVVLAERPVPLGPVLRGGLGYWYASVAPMVGQLDVVIVGAVAGPGASGLYGAASRLMGPLNIVANAMTNVFVPRLAAVSAEGDRRLVEYRASRRSAWIIAALVVLVSPVAAWLTRLVLGAEFVGVEPVVIGFCAAAALSGVCRVEQALLIARDEPRKAATPVLVGALVLFLLIVTLAPLGSWGLAAAPVLAHMVVLALLLRAVAVTSEAV